MSAYRLTLGIGQSFKLMDAYGHMQPSSMNIPIQSPDEDEPTLFSNVL